ncbi:MAG: DNA-directed RNA polymerase subunit omega [Spirochaetaceae bacterium]|nr:MAG: DNA-directed RNA polymerase subunit omega [Spirochaetaceae bacterium]
MITPMDLLENAEVNMYELTVATIRRAYQLTMTGDAELAKNNGKVVPTAIQQILTQKVAYRLEE